MVPSLSLVAEGGERPEGAPLRLGLPSPLQMM